MKLSKEKMDNMRNKTRNRRTKRVMKDRREKKEMDMNKTTQEHPNTNLVRNKQVRMMMRVDKISVTRVIPKMWMSY